MTKNLISYSLWGNEPRYIENMFRNFPARDKYYAAWDIRIYNQDITQATYDKLNSYGCELVPSKWMPLHPMFTRFYAAEDTDYDAVIFRDADSILNYRESKAVAEWLQSGKVLHSMRDAEPHNCAFQGGMWGIRPKFKKENLIEWMHKIMDIASQENYVHRSGYTWGDQTFLDAFCFTHYEKTDILAHDNQDRHWDKQTVRKFPTGERPKQHVGYAFVYVEDIEKDPNEC